MDHRHHHEQASHLHDVAPGARPSLDRTAISATIHCLTGCGIGEVMGMVVGTAFGWSNGATIAAAVLLAFLFGYLLTLRPLLRQMSFSSAAKLAFAADTVSIGVMEVVDNAVMVAIPGAMDAGLTSLLFWSSLVLALVLAGVVAFPVNRWLIARGKGHAIVHAHHESDAAVGATNRLRDGRGPVSPRQ